MQKKKYEDLKSKNKSIVEKMKMKDGQLMDCENSISLSRTVPPTIPNKNSSSFEQFEQEIMVQSTLIKKNNKNQSFMSFGGINLKKKS